MSNRKPTRGIAVLGTRIWLDVSSHSVVLVCNECTFQAIAFSREDAEEQCTKHWAHHKGVNGWGKNFVSTQQPCRWDDDCLGVHMAHGLCRRHYAQMKYHREMDNPDAPRCTIEECGRVALKVKRTLCDMHYQRKRQGKPMNAERQPRKPRAAAPARPVRLCTVEGCETRHYAKGFCTKHYYADKRRQENKPERQPAAGLVCGVEDCEKARKSKGLCQMHYFRERRSAA